MSYKKDFGCASWGLLPSCLAIESRLILKFFKDLVYWLSEHSTDYFSSSKSKMPRKIFPRSIVIVPIRPEIPSILRDHLSFPLPLLLVLLNLLILINMVHELTHTPNWFPSQRLSLIMFNGQADLESPYSHVIKVPIYLVEHLLIPIKIRFQDLPLSYGHRQQGIQGPGNPTTSHKTSHKCLSKLLKGANRTFFQAAKPSHCHRTQTR